MTDARGERRDETDQRSRRVGRIVLFGLLLTVCWVIGWQILSLRLEAFVEDWCKAQSIDGQQITYRTSNHGGFPFAIKVTLEETVWRQQRASGEIATHPTRVDVFVELLAPSLLKIEAPDGLVLTQTTSKQIVAKAEHVQASVSLNKPGPTLNLSLENATRYDEAGSILATAQSLNLSWQGSREEIADAPSPAVPALGRLSLKATNLLTHELAIESPANVDAKLLIRGQNKSLRSLSAWRDSGGVIDFEQLHLSWKDVYATADGSLTLDEQFRPEGAGMVEVKGIESAINHFRDRGALTPTVSALMKVATALAQRPASDGAGRSVTLPVTAQSGILSVGSFQVGRLMTLQDVSW